MLQLKLVDVLIGLSSINTHASQSIHINAHFYSWLLFCKDIHVWDTLFMVHEMSMVHSSFILNMVVHHLMSSGIMSCSFSDLPVLLTSTVSQLANHGRQTDKTMATVNIISWDQQCQMFYDSSPREVAPLFPREIFASVSPLDSGWPNSRVSNESILSSTGQLASIKLNINCDTWATHKSAAMIEVQGRRMLAYNKGKKEVYSAYNYGQ